jgi:hypothetical protein
MLTVMTVVALVVYDRLGLVVLRSARRNSDRRVRARRRRALVT